MLNAHTDEELVTNQLEISPYCLENFDNGNIDFLLKENIKPMAWSPLAGGKLLNPIGEKSKRIYKVLTEIAEEFGTNSIDTIIYAWILNHPAQILPIVGSGKMDRIQHAIDALKVNLSTEQWYRIYTASTGNELP